MRKIDWDVPPMTKKDWVVLTAVGSLLSCAAVAVPFINRYVYDGIDAIKTFIGERMMRK